VGAAGLSPADYVQEGGQDGAEEGTALLSATAIGKSPREGFDFFPLTVDVEERMYAGGKIPASYFRREGRPSTEAILAARLIDRPRVCARLSHAGWFTCWHKSSPSRGIFEKYV